MVIVVEKVSQEQDLEWSVLTKNAEFNTFQQNVSYSAYQIK